jgi:hypothetical protein
MIALAGRVAVGPPQSKGDRWHRGCCAIASEAEQSEIGVLRAAGLKFTQLERQRLQTEVQSDEEFAVVPGRSAADRRGADGHLVRETLCSNGDALVRVDPNQ